MQGSSKDKAPGIKTPTRCTFVVNDPVSHSDYAVLFDDNGCELFRVRGADNFGRISIIGDILDAHEELIAAKNMAYAERQKMVAALTYIFPSHMKRHPDSDTTWENDWRNIVCIHGPAGQMTWHIHDSECHLFGHLNHKPDPFADCEYDGHTTEEKYRRLFQSVAPAAQAQREG